MFLHRPINAAAAAKQLEDAIAIALLGVPEFREKAGLGPFPRGGVTLQEIADVTGLTRQMVHTLEQRALRKLRTSPAALRLLAEWQQERAESDN